MTWTAPGAAALLIAPMVLFVLAVAQWRWKKRLLAEAGDPAVLRRLFDPMAQRHQWVKNLLILLGLFWITVAIAGPRWGERFQEVHRRGVDVMIAVDVSSSMLAEDVKPNRLTQAKREMGQLIQMLESDRVGIVAFAGASFLQCPLTLDYGAARSILDLLNTDLIPRPGTNLAAALTTALDAFPSGGGRQKALVLLTDGEDHSGQLDRAAERALMDGLRIFPIGFGNPAGEIIPLRDENGQVVGYKKDKKGQTVLSKMDETALRRLAEKTGGVYFPASQGEVEITKIVEAIGRMEKKDLDSRVYGQGENHYRWPLGVGTLLLLLEFLWPEVRRHWGRVFGDIRAGHFLAILFLSLGMARPSRGLGRFPRSSELAPLVQKNPGAPEPQFNLGLALYLEGSYAAAAEAFEKVASRVTDPVTKAAVLYNIGNARYRQGQINEAIAQYTESLRLVATDPDAKHNLEMAKNLSRQQKQQKQDPKPDDKKGGTSPGESSPKPASMSKEDAQRLLEALADQQKKAQKKPQKKEEPSVDEDW